MWIGGEGEHEAEIYEMTAADNLAPVTLVTYLHKNTTTCALRCPLCLFVFPERSRDGTAAKVAKIRIQEGD
ncbi:hypothetical protein E2C01_076073 [Portunus trituberculatus]|uniref:Uncharacterized protein n=1 Tax=Portunus trituberculatus TaxID=210409 RepID=A0A5B7IHE5_PORTR|nr:hypothetical protein [Portunus trituberculatus]